MAWPGLLGAVPVWANDVTAVQIRIPVDRKTRLRP
jgi:hypothetical protein